MIDRVYCHVNEDYDFLRAAVHQAIGLGGKAKTPAMAAADTASSQNGQPGRPQHADNGANGNHAPPATHPDDSLVRILLNRLSALEERLVDSPPAAAPAPPKMRAHQAIAFELAQRAVKEHPRLKTDREIFVWLRKDPERRAQLPPTLDAFRRYLLDARRHYFGCTKRELRRAGLGRGAGAETATDQPPAELVAAAVVVSGPESPPPAKAGSGSRAG
jgi:hypothetical protein